MTALRNIAALVEKEWRHYFGSPIAYVALCIWALLFGFFYFLVVNRFIVYSMRAGANEFFTWPPPEEAFNGAIRRTAARRETSHGARPSATTLVFFGAKGGAGTTTLSVNCGVELARLSKRSTIIVDLKPGLGEVALFLGVRPRYTLLDAIDNLHRLDREFLRELVLKHKSGLEILAGSDQFDRPGAADGGAIEELLRLLARQYEYIVIDAGSQINSCTVAALYSADQMFLVANPDVPSVRNAQRLSRGESLDGPVIVEQVDSTTIVPPGAVARVGEIGELLIRV
jgi:pilus assembly protein CpaE